MHYQNVSLSLSFMISYLEIYLALKGERKHFKCKWVLLPHYCISTLLDGAGEHDGFNDGRVLRNRTICLLHNKYSDYVWWINGLKEIIKRICELDIFVKKFFLKFVFIFNLYCSISIEMHINNILLSSDVYEIGTK